MKIQPKLLFLSLLLLPSKSFGSPNPVNAETLMRDHQSQWAAMDAFRTDYSIDTIGPDGQTVNKTSMIFERSADKFRVKSVGSGKEPLNEEQTFDGKTIRNLVESEGKIPSGSIDPSKHLALKIRRADDPFTIGNGTLLPDTFDANKSMFEFHDQGLEEYKGQESRKILLICPFDKTRKAYTTYWFHEQDKKNYLVKWTTLIDNNPEKPVTTKTFEYNYRSPNSLFPVSVESIQYPLNPNDRSPPVHKIYHFKNVDLHPKFNDDDFILKFPNGTIVSDHIARQDYTAGDVKYIDQRLASLGEFPVSGETSGPPEPQRNTDRVAAAQLVNKKYGNSMAVKNRSFWFISAIVGIGGAAIYAIYYIKKIRRNDCVFSDAGKLGR